MHPSTLLLACSRYHVVEIHCAPCLGVIRRKEMTLKCKLLSVVISTDSPLPFNSTESIMLCLISAMIAPEKRCRSHRVERSAFQKSSRCSFQVVCGERIALPLYFIAVLALTLGQKWWKMSLTKIGREAVPLYNVSGGWWCKAREAALEFTNTRTCC